MVKEQSTSIKKKRKAATTGDADQEVDIYKKVVDFEEKEAKAREPNNDAEIYYSVCKEIRDLLAELNTVKTDKTSEGCAKKMEFFGDVCVRLAVIKKLNRIDKIQHVLGKEMLVAEKQKCDSTKLGYQNLVYELHHLLSEINKCTAFKSRDEDIELISLEEFMSNAPESMTKKFAKYDENDSDMKHALRLARLEYELQQRKSLAALYQSLIEEKKKLAADIVEQKNKLDALNPLLTNILNATKPLQAHLDIPIDEVRQEHKLANLLPSPLYIFYANVVSYNSVYCVNLTTDIKGDQDEAVQWNEAHNANKDDDESELEDTNDVEEVVEVKKRRHRKSSQVDPMEEKKKKLLEVHPLSVDVTMPIKDGPSITISLKYYTRLKIVTVSSKVDMPSTITGNTARDILLGENVLGDLLPNDNGLESPNPSTAYQLRKVGLGSFQSLIPVIGHAYIWAQGVCGIDFLKRIVSSDDVGQANVEIVMKTLHKRLVARNELAVQLQQLEQNIIPQVPSTVNIPQNAVSAITKWSSITYTKYCQAEFTQPIVEDEIVQSSDLFYSVTISRSNATLTAYIVLKNCYPSTPPLFSLSLNYNSGVYHSGNNDDIRDIERLINVECTQGFSGMAWMLSAQVCHLCSYLDIYLETQDSVAFPQNSKFLRSICGRNRRKPFKYRKIGSGIFTQY